MGCAPAGLWESPFKSGLAVDDGAQRKSCFCSKGKVGHLLPPVQGAMNSRLGKKAGSANPTSLGAKEHHWVFFV